MDDRQLEGELRELQRRAYGPGDGIDGDRAALQRLRELEGWSLERTEARSGVPANAGDIPAPPDTVAFVGEPDPSALARGDAMDTTGSEEAPAHGGAAADGTAPTNTGPPAAAAERRPWPRTKLAAVWIGSVVVAVLTAVWMTMTFSPAPAAGRQVAVLSVDADAEWPSGVFGDRPPDSRLTEDFHGLMVAILPGTSSGLDAAAQCLYVIQDIEGGFLGGGCGAGDFAPNAAIVVTSTLPPELRDEFPDDSALRFVLDGSQVLVYSDAP